MKKLAGIVLILAAAGVAFAGEMEQAAVSSDIKNLGLQTIRTMGVSSLANPLPQRDISFSKGSSYSRTCGNWLYGYSGTFDCPSGYMGAVRGCSLYDPSGNQVDSWEEEGCATGIVAETGYCVKYCDGAKSAAPGTGVLKAVEPDIRSIVYKGFEVSASPYHGNIEDTTILSDILCLDTDRLGAFLNGYIPEKGRCRYKSQDINPSWTVAMLVAETEQRNKHCN